ncbi:UNVERIFIED_CONTAM: hypothetical protein K2H54_061652 [Gekko kuhli]
MSHLDLLLAHGSEPKLTLARDEAQLIFWIGRLCRQVGPSEPGKGGFLLWEGVGLRLGSSAVRTDTERLLEERDPEGERHGVGLEAGWTASRWV